MALLKVRVVVVVLIRRLTDLKMREAARLIFLKMRVAVAALLKMREAVLLQVRVVVL